MGKVAVVMGSDSIACNDDAENWKKWEWAVRYIFHLPTECPIKLLLLQKG